jgi:phospholipid-transporting ATPase
MIIALIPSISPLEPATTIMPVVIVMIINLIREIVEDYRKYSNDKTVKKIYIK